MGKLAQAQVERVREYAERTPLLDELRDRDRKRLQREVLAHACARARRQARCPSWPRTGSAAASRPTSRRSTPGATQYFALLLDLDRTLSPEQRSTRARAAAALRRRLRRAGRAMNDPQALRVGEEPSAAAERRPRATPGRTRYTQLEYKAMLANASIGIAFTRERTLLPVQPEVRRDARLRRPTS